MFYYNGFVCGGEPEGPIRITEVKALADMMMLLTFNNGEQRLFDASILTGPAFQPLKEESIFLNPGLDHGVVTWKNGEIDCAPEYMFSNSYEYAREAV